MLILKNALVPGLSSKWAIGALFVFVRGVA